MSKRKRNVLLTYLLWTLLAPPLSYACGVATIMYGSLFAAAFIHWVVLYPVGLLVIAITASEI